MCHQPPFSPGTVLLFTSSDYNTRFLNLIAMFLFHLAFVLFQTSYKIAHDTINKPLHFFALARMHFLIVTELDLN